MPIMYLRNKCGRLVVLAVLALTAVNAVFASEALPWMANKGEAITITMTDASAYVLKLPPDVGGVFYERGKHLIGGQSYIAVFQVSPSNPAKPLGFCGAGSEVWLSVYQVAGSELSAQTKMLVSSCLQSISMVSQNSGDEAQDTDFSSVTWNEQGFSIAWFEHVDAKGRPLSSTHYRMQEGMFIPREVVSE